MCTLLHLWNNRKVKRCGSNAQCNNRCVMAAAEFDQFSNRNSILVICLWLGLGTSYFQSALQWRRVDVSTVQRVLTPCTRFKKNGPSLFRTTSLMGKIKNLCLQNRGCKPNKKSCIPLLHGYCSKGW